MKPSGCSGIAARNLTAVHCFTETLCAVLSSGINRLTELGGVATNHSCSTTFVRLHARPVNSKLAASKNWGEKFLKGGGADVYKMVTNEPIGDAMRQKVKGIFCKLHKPLYFSFSIV